MISITDDDTLSRKRQRVDLEGTAASTQSYQVDETHAPLNDTELKKHERLWFDDGSIVLVARDTTFRVHASILSRESAVFRNMIETMKEMKSERMHDCPVMRLSDTAMDLAVLLSILYDGASSLGADPRPLPFSEVASAIRMAHKYGIGRIRDDALARLKTCFPSHFDRDSWNMFAQGRSSVITTSKEDAIVAVILARLTKTHSILPMALYRCCAEVQFVKLVSGVRREDGTVDRLSPQDLIGCLSGIEKLLSAKAAASAWMFRLRDAHLDCSQPSHCIKTISILPELANEAEILATHRALDLLLPSLKLDRMALCSACRNMIFAKDLDARRDIFERLPTYLGVTVDGWATRDV